MTLSLQDTNISILGKPILYRDRWEKNFGAMSTYRSEVYIPIRPDELTFEERQRHLWKELDLRMEARRQEWEQEIAKMRDEFFSLKPMDFQATTRLNNIERVDNMKTVYVRGKDGSPRFKVRFDVHEFKPSEISVQTQDNHLLVKARHEEKTGTTTIKREFSRQVDIPSNVDSKSLQASVTKDGILIIDGPVRAPEYNALSDSLTRGALMPSSFFANTSSVGPIITKSDGTRELRLEIEVGTTYKPEEITVKTVDRKIVIHARHEEKVGNRTSFSEFNKEYELPESVDPFTVNSYLLDTGKLVIEAPLQSEMPPSPQPIEGNRVMINVQRRGAGPTITIRNQGGGSGAHILVTPQDVSGSRSPSLSVTFRHKTRLYRSGHTSARSLPILTTALKFYKIMNTINADIYADNDRIPRIIARRALYDVNFLNDNYPRILDMGCGAGDVVKMIFKRFPHTDMIYAFDKEPMMIDYARQNHYDDKIQYGVASADELTSLNPKWRQIDLLTSFSALHWVEDNKEGVIETLKTVLNPGGEFVITATFECGMVRAYPAIIKYITKSDEYKSYFPDQYEWKPCWPESAKVQREFRNSILRYEKLIEDAGLEIICSDILSETVFYHHDDDCRAMVYSMFPHVHVVPQDLQRQLIDDVLRIYAHANGRTDDGCLQDTEKYIRIHGRNNSQ